MLNENAKKWIEELRSGKWKQHKGALTNEDRNAFCCLGVACELAVAEGVIPASEKGESGYYHGLHVACLPDDVRDWLGLADNEGKCLDGRTLSGHNDGGMSFNEIAGIIESEPPGLFKE